MFRVCFGNPDWTTFVLCKTIQRCSEKSFIMQVEVFLFEGCYFIGNLAEAEARYDQLNPSKKFYIWLCDNYVELVKVNNQPAL
jgi:hypothetical protein